MWLKDWPPSLQQLQAVTWRKMRNRVHATQKQQPAHKQCAEWQKLEACSPAGVAQSQHIQTEHATHTRTCWKAPSGVRTAWMSCPVPWHMLQLLGLVPGFTPLLVQVLQPAVHQVDTQ